MPGRKPSLPEKPASRCGSSLRPVELAVHRLEDGVGENSELIGGAFFALDAQWRFTYLNTRAETLLNRTAAELIGRELWVCYPQLLATEFERLYRQAGNRPGTKSVNAFHSAQNRWYEVAASSADGGLSVYFRDSTSQREIETEREQSLEKSERQRRVYETALSNSADFIYVFDLEGRFTYVNFALLALWQKSLDEAVGRNFFELDYPAELAARLQEQIQRVIDTRQPLRDETPYTAVTGTRSYEYIFVPVFAEDGSIEAVAGSTRDITERKQAEADTGRLLRALKAEQERLANVFQCAPSFMAVLGGSDHVIELSNDRYFEMVGRRDIIGKPVRVALPEVEGQGFLELLDQVYRTGVDFVGNEVAIRLQREAEQPAEERFVDFVYQALRDSDGRITGVLVQGVDLTERKRAERELKASEERYREAAVEAAKAAEANAKFRVFFEQGTQFAGVLALDGTVVEANRLSLDACGFTRGDVSDKPFWECGWWSPSGELQAMVRQAVTQAASGELFRRESHYYVGDGSEREVDLILAPVTDDAGRVLFVAATGTDITERKRAEAAARKSDARFRNMADSAPVLIWESDATGVNFVNHHYLAFFGRPFDDLQGMGWAAMLHPDEAPGYLEIYRTAYSRREQFARHARILRHDGEYRWMLTSGFPHHGPDGVFLGFVGSSVDVTDLKQAEESQRELADELVRAHRQKDEFLALLAHELRNPLAPLRNGLEVMQLCDDPVTVARAREMMERQLGHLVRLIDDLLDISRISTGKMRLRCSRVSLDKIIESAVETARPAIAAADHALEVVVPCETVELDADFTRVAQVLSNLLINSAKYTPCGGRIVLTAVVEEDMIAIAVRDTGIGIPTDELTSIFHMFSQVDRSIERTTGGLGIGLALVKGLAEMHGGTVAAFSAGRGAGSTFTVRLPRRVADRQPKDRPLAASQSDRRPRRRILVVDDNLDSATSMAGLLTIRGHEVTCSHDGRAAVVEAGNLLPDIILMDIGMPVMNGYDATRRIREHPWGRRILIIALTGWGQDHDRDDSRDAGCDAHLVKPVELSELERLIDRLAPQPAAG